MPLDSLAEQDALTLLSELVKVDTSNPPGNERGCAELLAEFLRAEGLEPRLLEKEPGRTNLVVRLAGDGTGGGPLMLAGHLDVVGAKAEGWKHPPFSAAIDEGWLWGRGAVDMKSFVAAAAAIVRQLKREGVRLKRDLILAAVADEETGCDLGARFLVDEHADLVRAEWAIGEAGGFTLQVGEKRLYPIGIAHKGAAWISMKARGAAGHGSMPRDDTSVLRLARALSRIGNQPLPVHVCAPTRQMLRAMGQAQGFPASLGLAMLARPALTEFALENVVGDPEVRRTFGALLRNTATPTALRAGEATNVVPEEAVAQLDGRILPGQTTAHLLSELARVVEDPEITFTVLKELAAVESPVDSPLYERLAAAVKEMDPEGIAVPYLMPGFTDASAFCRLGMHFYGFSPLRLPDDAKVRFSELPHGVDERLPIEGWKIGMRALDSAIRGFCAA